MSQPLSSSCTQESYPDSNATRPSDFQASHTALYVMLRRVLSSIPTDRVTLQARVEFVANLIQGALLLALCLTLALEGLQRYVDA